MCNTVMYSLLGLVVAHLQCGVIVNEGGFKFIDSDPVNAALFTVELDPVQVDHSGEDGQLDIALRDAGETGTAVLFIKHSSYTGSVKKHSTSISK